MIAFAYRVGALNVDQGLCSVETERGPLCFRQRAHDQPTDRGRIRRVCVHDVDALLSEVAAQAPGPADVALVAHVETGALHAEGFQLGHEMLLPGQQVHDLDIERVAIVRARGRDQQAFGTARAESLHQPDDPPPARGHRSSAAGLFSGMP